MHHPARRHDLVLSLLGREGGAGVVLVGVQGATSLGEETVDLLICYIYILLKFFLLGTLMIARDSNDIKSKSWLC